MARVRTLGVLVSAGLLGLLRCAPPVRPALAPPVSLSAPGAPPVPPAAALAPATLSPADAVAAFARLYGVVRWFHPSDEAAGADWDAVAVAGVEAALAARSPEELRRGLDAVFGPLAPTMQLWGQAEAPPPPRVHAGPGPVIAWQHLGWSFGGDQPIYRSLRLGRAGLAVTDGGAVTAVNGEPADGLEGRRIRVSARVRVEAPAPAGGFLWLRIDHGPRDEAATRVGWDAPRLEEPGWHRYEVSAELPQDATWYVFGVRLAGRGTLWADDFRVEVQEPDGSWRRLPVRDGGFEDRERWWVFDGLGYDADVVEERGDAVLRLTHQDLLREALFPEAPALGEAFERPIGAGLVARVPLALPDGPGAPAAPALARVPADRDDRAVRVAATVVAWNVLRHFHPYEAELHTDWEARLAEVVDRALVAPDRGAVVEALWGLQVGVPDGHAWVGHRAVTGRTCGLGLRWLRVGEELVVTSSAEPDVAVGDRVLSLAPEDPACAAPARAAAGVCGAAPLPVPAALARARDHVSGSEPFREAFAAERLASGPCGSALVVELERAGARRVVRVERSGGAPPLFEHPGVDPGPDGIVMVDLNTMAWEELAPHLDTFAAARGLVFDLREYPAPGALHVLEHLLSRPDRATGWMRVPMIVRPGEVAGWERHEWGLQPERPHLGGKVVFLTSSLAISAAESLLALVKAEGLGTLVGTRTAGTNGNATGAVLPGGYWIQFTGMRVVQPDGAPFHLLGVAPDVEVTPTLAGLRAGRDEVRDAAVEWLRRAR